MTIRFAATTVLAGISALALAACGPDPTSTETDMAAEDMDMATDDTMTQTAGCSREPSLAVLPG